MPNNRIFYASHAVQVNNVTVHGAQSVGVNTNFNLEQVFQLGRIAIYDNLSVDPEVEVTINKALDGHNLIWSLARGNVIDALVESANDQSDIELGVGADNQEVIGLVANTSVITMTGCFVNSLNYTFPVEGNFTEEVTFVGSHKSAAGAVTAPDPTPLPVIVGHVLRRQNVMMGTSILPAALTGKRLSNISISTSFNREKMFTLGKFSPFHRFVNFPIEVTVTFDVIADEVAIHPDVLFDVFEAECESRDGSAREHIKINLCNSAGDADLYVFDLGSGCSLQSVNYSGGDTGGGNVTETYTYITYNDLTITDNST